MVSVASCPTLLVLVGRASSSSLLTTVWRRTFVHVDHRARAGHGDRFFDPADTHVGVDVRGESGAQDECPSRTTVLNPVSVKVTRVHAGPQLRDGETPLAVGDGDALLFDEDRAGGCDGDARQNGA